ncbi:FHA domain-containing protein [Naasia sp. SYSU D00948]|uniref:FHA domain-containing protein n=1 Tax=Naasia sp. SYSU D00948 TaxID=2817379 RepID=UPI0027DC83C3|nr:FHA domain-containing protein [Naasia sp. SYSU D00948]
MSSGHAFYSPLAADVGGGLNWIFFAAGRVLAGFEPAASTEVVMSLWRTATAPDASIESVVAAIPTRGPAAVGSFAVVVIGSRTTLVLRGRGSVDVQTAAGQRRIDSRNMQPWYLAEFDGVQGLALGSVERPVGVDTAPTSADLPLMSGVVRAPWLAWTPLDPGQPQRPAPAPERRRARRAAATIAPPQSVPTITGSIPVQNLAAAPGPYRAPITTPIPVIPAASAPVPPMPPSRAAVGNTGDTRDLDDTVRGLGTGRFRGDDRVAEVSRASEAAGDIGDTIVTSRRRHRADVPPLTTWSPSRIEFDPRFSPGQERSSGYYCFRIGNGQVYRLDTPVYIGRKPSSPRIVTGTLPRLLRIASPSMEVSSTHVELRQEGASVVVTDMRSTNGTFVSQPGSAPIKLRQGESMVVTPGTLVDIGDGNVIEILPIR